MADKLYVIIPAYNEADNIGEIIEDWHAVVDRYGNEESRLVIVDDGSTDDTFTILENIKKQYEKLIVKTKQNGGHGSAVLFGYRYALANKADYIFQTDSDRQTTPSDFSGFWEERRKFDAIIGNRKRRGDGKARAFVEKVVCLLLKIYFRVNVPDANAPFRLMSQRVLVKYIDKLPKDYFLPNIMLTAYFVRNEEKVRFKEISFKPRQGGVNSINIKKIIQIGWQALLDFKKFKNDMEG